LSLQFNPQFHLRFCCKYYDQIEQTHKAVAALLIYFQSLYSFFDIQR
jgi:hypothetical protein